MPRFFLNVLVAAEPCDMRRSFDGLHHAVADDLNEAPTAGRSCRYSRHQTAPYEMKCPGH